ncbi:MAG: tetratricopeptide repeat protein [Flavobacteriales bacterium]|nr:tetratricopeptide repeat protein [Flavobacteriales bacterium]
MNTRKILACLAALLLISTSALAQGGRLAEEADDAYNKGFYFNAIELYKKAYTVEKKAAVKAELIFKVAESYRMIGDVQQAQVWYEKANKAQFTDPIAHFWIAEMQRQQGKYADAIASYNRYKEKKSNDPRTEAGIAACQMAQKWKDSPTRYSVDPEVLLNTPSLITAPHSPTRRMRALFSRALVPLPPVPIPMPLLGRPSPTSSPAPVIAWVNGANR